MTIIDHPSPNHSPRKEGVRVDTVLLHHTATALVSSALKWMRRLESRVSCHYLVSQAGDILRLVPEDRTAWHAGVSHMPWEKPEENGSVNARSIGIELVNPGDGVTPFTEAQYAALEWLVPDIVQRLGWRVVSVGWRNEGPGAAIPLRHGTAGTTGPGFVLGHRDVAPGRKTDPADNFDWGRIRQALAGSET